MVGTPDPYRSRAVLIGVSNYQMMKPVPAALENLSELARVLRDVRVWGLPQENCRVVPNPKMPDDLFGPLQQAAAEAEDTLLLYYTGHGFGHPVERKLRLTHVNSDAQREWTTVDYMQLRRVMSSSRAMRQVVILDCCYSGLAIGALADPATELANILPNEFDTEGTYVLTATAENVVALAPENERFTAFTAELLNVMERGIQRRGAFLDLRSIYVELLNIMRLKKMPEPRNMAKDTAAELTLIRNRAFHQCSPSKQPSGDYRNTTGAVLYTATSILAEAERAVQWVDEHSRERVLIRLAEVTAAVDPDRAELLPLAIPDERLAYRMLIQVARGLAVSDASRATRVLAEAEHIAESQDDASAKELMLADIAEILATVDRDSAARVLADVECVVQDIHKYARGWILNRIAEVMAAVVPERAEAIARSLPKRNRERAQYSIAKVMATIDPERAEAIARSLPKREHLQADLLAHLAKALAPTNPDHAEKMAWSIRMQDSQAEALASIAQIVNTTDPERAVRIVADVEGIEHIPEYSKSRIQIRLAEAMAIIDPLRATRILKDAFSSWHSRDEEKSLVFIRVATMMMATDPERATWLLAESFNAAQQMDDNDKQASALGQVAEVLIRIDLDRAVRVLVEAERIAQLIPGKDSKAAVLTQLAETIATKDPDHAERIAQSVPGMDRKGQALARIAEILAATDPDRAERIAQSIPLKHIRAQVLADITKAIFVTDSNRATRIIASACSVAESIDDDYLKAMTWLEIAQSANFEGAV